LNIKGIKEWIKMKNTFYEKDISVFHPNYSSSKRQTSRRQKVERQVGHGARPAIQMSGEFWFCFEAKIRPMQCMHLDKTGRELKIRGRRGDRPNYSRNLSNCRNKPHWPALASSAILLALSIPGLLED
jgi:hypothetical protein